MGNSVGSLIGFKNRAGRLNMGWKTVEESMSAMQFCTAPKGDLPH